MNYVITNLRPSDIRWLDENLTLENVRQDFVRRVVRLISHEINDVAHLDTIYCSGIQLSKAYRMLHEEQKKIINNIDTSAA